MENHRLPASLPHIYANIVAAHSITKFQTEFDKKTDFEKFDLNFADVVNCCHDYCIY